jgi:hypothetical protein
VPRPPQPFNPALIAGAPWPRTHSGLWICHAVAPPLLAAPKHRLAVDSFIS